MATAGMQGEASHAVQLGSLLEHRDEDHPLHWLQPTPEISAPLAMHLPDCRLRLALHLPDFRLRREPKPLGSPSSLHDERSETSTAAGDRVDASPEGCSEVGSCGSDEAEWLWSAPPQLTPRISSCSSPPPPPAAAPWELPPCSFPLETPSPTAAYAMCASLQAAHASLQASTLVPSLFEAAEGFSALGAWSEALEDGYGYSSHVVQAATNQPATWAGFPSVGSAEHEAGKCKPCAFVHRPMGCADGAACIFCHFCEPDEKKRRQRQKFEATRQRRLSRKAAGAGYLEAAAGRTPVARVVPSLAQASAPSAFNSCFEALQQPQQQLQQNHRLCGQVTSANVTEAMTSRRAALQKTGFELVQHQQNLHFFGELPSAALAAETISAALPALCTAPVARLSGWGAAPR